MDAKTDTDGRVAEMLVLILIGAMIIVVGVLLGVLVAMRSSSTSSIVCCGGAVPFPSPEPDPQGQSDVWVVWQGKTAGASAQLKLSKDGAIVQPIAAVAPASPTSTWSGLGQGQYCSEIASACTVQKAVMVNNGNVTNLGQTTPNTYCWSAIADHWNLGLRWEVSCPR
jgi:hypothetical protein